MTDTTPTTQQETAQDKVQDVLPTQISKTYEQTAIDWLGALYGQLKDVPEAQYLFGFEDTPNETTKEAVIRFAHYLDAFNTLDVRLELLALRQMSKIDREFMAEMIDELGLEKAKEIAYKVNSKHNMGFNEAINNEVKQSV